MMPGRPRHRWLLLLPLLLVPVLVAVLLIGWFSDQHRRTAALERADAAFQQGDCTGALAGFAEADRNAIPWSGQVQARFPDATERSQCGELRELAAGWKAGNLADVTARYDTFGSRNPDSPALLTLWTLVQQSARSKVLLKHLSQPAACAALKSLRQTSSSLNHDLNTSAALKRLQVPRVGATRYQPADLVTCAKTFEKGGSTADANAFYAEAVRLKPARALLATATGGLARTDVQLARQSHPGHLPAPARVSGSGSGPAVVVIQNDSPDQLELTMSGTKPVLDTVGACSGCQNYHGTGPASCPEQGPKRSFTVPAGVYSVAVRSDRGGAVTPFVGSWDLTKGSRYETCFFIVSKK
jgi:hypothetical protein